MNTTAYQVITDRLISMLEAGTAPWKKPWSGGAEAFPKNISSKKHYTGINVWMLHMTGHTSSYFCTFNQAKELGGTVRKGEKGFPVVFTKALPPRAEEISHAAAEGRKPRNGRMLRYYTVFNVDQCEGIAAPDAGSVKTFAHDPIASAENIFAAMPNRPQVTFGSNGATYSPQADHINMPDAARFTTRPEYYGTLFHELAHATGHASRLARAEVMAPNAFGSEPYGKEELVAEMASAYVCGAAGIESDIIDNSAAYLAGWISALKGDPKLAIHAAAAAQRAADYILNRAGAPQI